MYLNFRLERIATLHDRIKAAVKAHYIRFNALPVGLVVPKAEVQEAQQIAQQLELNGIKIEGSGGCLNYEVWTEVA